MSDSHAHETILFFLDVLYRYEGFVAVADLYSHLDDKECGPGIRAAVSDSEDGVKKFLSRFPSLFVVKGDAVAPQMASGGGGAGAGGGAADRASASSTYGGSSVEADAVNYFKMKMARKEEKFLPIVSVAGYASQSSNDVRKFVGPQTDFKKFLLKYPEVFEVQGEYVALRERVTSSANGDAEGRPEGVAARALNGSSPGSAPFSPQLGRGRGRLHPNDTRALTFLLRLLQKRPKLTFGALAKLMAVAPEGVRNAVGVTRDDQSRFLRRHQNIFNVTVDGTVSLKPEGGVGGVGVIGGGMSSASSGSPTSSTSAIPVAVANQEPSLVCQFGIVMKVFPKFGIIDNGNSEQVFFDAEVFHFAPSANHAEMSSLLTKVLQIGDHVCFNAVVGPKGASAKWKAVDVWHYDGDSGGDLKELRALTASFSVSDDAASSVAAFHKRSSRRSSTSSMDGIASPAYSGGGGGGDRRHHHHRDELERAVRRYAANYGATEDRPAPGTPGTPGRAASEKTAPSASMAPEFGDDVVVNAVPVLSYIPNEAPLRLVPADQGVAGQRVVAPSTRSAVNGAAAPGQFDDQEGDAAIVKIAAPVVRGNLVDAGCQTMSTGPILATGIFMEG